MRKHKNKIEGGADCHRDSHLRVKVTDTKSENRDKWNITSNDRAGLYTVFSSHHQTSMSKWVDVLCIYHVSFNDLAGPVTGLNVGGYIHSESFELSSAVTHYSLHVVNRQLLLCFSLPQWYHRVTKTQNANTSDSILSANQNQVISYLFEWGVRLVCAQSASLQSIDG